MKVTTADLLNVLYAFRNQKCMLELEFGSVLFECVQLANVHISFQSLKTRKLASGKFFQLENSTSLRNIRNKPCYKTVRTVINYCARSYVNVRVLTYVYLFSKLLTTVLLRGSRLKTLVLFFQMPPTSKKLSACA